MCAYLSHLYHFRHVKNWYIGDGSVVEAGVVRSLKKPEIELVT